MLEVWVPRAVGAGAVDTIAVGAWSCGWLPQLWVLGVVGAVVVGDGAVGKVSLWNRSLGSKGSTLVGSGCQFLP